MIEVVNKTELPMYELIQGQLLTMHILACDNCRYANVAYVDLKYMTVEGDIPGLACPNCNSNTDVYSPLYRKWHINGNLSDM